MELKLDFTNPEWWMWTLTLFSFPIGLLGHRWGYVLVIAISGVQVLYFLAKTKDYKAFSTQVRWAYLGLALLGWVEPTEILYLLMFISTAMVVLFDTCVLARVLRLMPWNRNVGG